MQHKRSQKYQAVLVFLVLLSTTQATPAADLYTTTSQKQSDSCATAKIDNTGIVLGSCDLGREPLSPVFPTDNKAVSVSGRELHELLSFSQHANSSRQTKGGLVVLFYLAGDPPSVAITPVFRCLSAFFDEEVQFVMVAYSELSLMALISQGLHALPVLQVNTIGRRFRYSGKHWLAPMLHFVARALGQQPAADLEVARFCSSSTQLPRNPSDPPPKTCRQRSLQDLFTASRGSAAAAAAAGVHGRCDRESMCTREWECVRWDGEVTLEELRAQRPAPLFYVSLGFLALRLLWLMQRWWKQKRRSRRSNAGVAAVPDPAAAAAGGGAAAAAPAVAAAAAVPPPAGQAGVAVESQLPVH